MLEGFALLISILGLIILQQTLKKYRRMRNINANASSVLGTVTSSNVTRNLMGGPGFGTSYRTLIQYQPPNARELHEISLFEHNLVMSNHYLQGESVEIVFDAQAPYRAYPKREWERVLKDFKKVWFCFGLSAAMLLIVWMIK